MFCPSYRLSCYLSSRGLTLVYHGAKDYTRRDRYNIKLVISSIRMDNVYSSLTTSVCRLTVSSTAPFVYLRKRTLNWKGLLIRLWTARWTFQLVIKGKLTLNLATEDPRLPTNLPTPDHHSFQVLPSLQFHRLLLTRMAFCSSHTFHQIPGRNVYTQKWLLCNCLVPVATVVRVRRQTLLRFLKLYNIPRIVPSTLNK